MADIDEVIKRQIGQHFVCGFHGDGVLPSDEISVLIKDYYLGNVIIMKRNIASLSQLTELLRNLQSLAKNAGHEQPLMIGIDQENGLVSAFSSTSSKTAGTQFPGAMALSATGDVDLAFAVSKATAQEMISCGIHWAYSPVADVNTNPRNPVIGVRSFGNDPIKVASFAVAVSEGLKAGGIASCAKHFPGHGDTMVDSHLSLPVISKSMEDLKRTELMPFKELTSAKHLVSSVMTGHISLPVAYEDNEPASLSKHTTSLLRTDLGYDGIIVTDCLEMEAIVQTHGTPGGAVASLISGADIAMICHRFERQKAAIKAAQEAYQDGRIPSKYLRESGERIRRFKAAHAHSWEQALGRNGPPDRVMSDHSLLSDKAYAASVCLVRNDNNYWPLKIGPILLFIPASESVNLAVDDPNEEGLLRTADNKVRNTAAPSYRAFTHALERRCAVDFVVYSSPEDCRGSLEKYSGIIFITRNAYRKREHSDALAEVASIAEKGAKPMVIVSSCDPEDFRSVREEVFSGGAAYICTFEYTAKAMEHCAAAIFGEIVPSGKNPMS